MWQACTAASTCLLEVRHFQGGPLTAVVCAVANTLLTSSPCISNTIQEMNTSMSQPICQSQTMRTVRSHGPAASPLASTRSAGAAISTAFSGLSVSAGNSGLLGQDTVAPCMKGANRNKARVRDVRSRATAPAPPPHCTDVVLKSCLCASNMPYRL